MLLYFLDRALAASRSESDVAHQREGEPEGERPGRAREHVGDSQVRRLRDHASGDGSAQHRGAFNDFASRKHRLELSSFAK